MRTAVQIALHVAVFIAAFFIFVLGLGIGLALNPAIGALLWLLGGLAAVGNVVWIVRHFRKRGG